MNNTNTSKLLVVISSPSGGGKDSVLQKLIEIIPNSTKLTTTTTRKPRKNEVNGSAYHFVSTDEFEKLINDDKLIEYNKYVNNFYGIEKENLEKDLNKYNIVFAQIDVNGKQSLDKLKYKHISFFLSPDSLQVLENRIIKRKGISTEILEKRLKIAIKELEKSNLYDYKINNKDGKLDETAQEIAKILLNNLSI